MEHIILREGDAFAPNEESRVLALINYDTDTHPPDGDALQPAYWDEVGHVSRAGDVYHDRQSDLIAELYLDAKNRLLERFGGAAGGYSIATMLRVDKVLHRWLWVYYQSRAYETGPAGDGVLLLDTPAFRAHVGRSPHSQDNMMWEADLWEAYVDGDMHVVTTVRLDGEVPDYGASTVSSILDREDVTILDSLSGIATFSEALKVARDSLDQYEPSV